MEDTAAFPIQIREIIMEVSTIKVWFRNFELIQFFFRQTEVQSQPEIQDAEIMDA